MFLVDRACVTCPDTPPSCSGSCKSNEQCTITTLTCESCPQIICKANPSSHAGAIAGGVLGGLAAILLAIGIYFWWRHRNGRHHRLNEAYSPDLDFPRKSGAPPGFRSSKVPSITSVNTNQARGSNIIPIAYVPGVTVLPKSGSHGNSGDIRQSIAASSYRASLPDFVMAVHGQPSLVQVGSTNENPPLGVHPQRTSSRGSGSRKYPDSDTSSIEGESAAFVSKLDSAFYSLSDNHGGLEPLGFPTSGGDTTELGAPKNMVTIHEDPAENGDFVLDENYGGGQNTLQGRKFGEFGHSIPDEGPRNYGYVPTRTSSKKSSQQSSDPLDRGSKYSRTSTVDRGSHYSRASSTGEYMLNLPEEAYLYHGAGHDDEDNSRH